MSEFLPVSLSICSKPLIKKKTVLGSAYFKPPCINNLTDEGLCGFYFSSACFRLNSSCSHMILWEQRPFWFLFQYGHMGIVIFCRCSHMTIWEHCSHLTLSERPILYNYATCVAKLHSNHALKLETVQCF